MTDFNLFTFNSRVFPGTEPLLARLGDRVRLRIANSRMDWHPIHVHGHHFRWTGTDGGPLPETAWIPETTMNVPPGTTRDVEFVADNPGDWAVHCHKVHHTMNQMGHGLPIMTGVDQSGVAEKIQALVPGYMPMGNTRHGRHDARAAAAQQPADGRRRGARSARSSWAACSPCSRCARTWRATTPTRAGTRTRRGRWRRRSNRARMRLRGGDDGGGGGGDGRCGDRRRRP